MNLRKLCIFMALVLFPLLLLASDSKNTPKNKAPDKPLPLTPQELDLQMLDAARSMLSHASAPLQAHACYQATVGYGLIDHARELSVLKDCFLETQALADEDSDLKAGLQLRILDAMYARDPATAEAFLPSAVPRAKINVQSRILQRLVDSKKYDEALTLAAQLSYSPDFPYRAAAELMVHLPAERDSDRRMVFLAALQSYRLQDPATDPAIEDMATLVIRFWRHLDSKLIMQAIDEILKHAQEDLQNENAPTLSIGTGLGEARFTTAYQYRLFELIPVIQQLDSGRAESILNDNPRLAEALKNYPQGLVSLEPTFRDSPLKPGESPKFTITHHLRAASSEAETALLHDRVVRESLEISGHAADDPRLAIQKAAQLPDTGVENGRSARADTLARIAIGLVRRHPDFAEDAVKQMLTASENYPPLAQSFYLLTAANIDFLMNNKAEASRMVEKASSIASHLYQRDIKNNDANHAFKFDWPSTAVWRACVVLQNKIDSVLAIGLLKHVSDPEIRASVQITLANIRLGGPLPANTVRQQFGDGPGSVQDFPLIR
jgi:hypothetical protein